MKPIIWNFDHALTLYPTPDTIILGDIAAQNVKSYMGVTCFNPGSFASDDTFIAYRPATREVEMSAIGCED
jgi:DNA polymerase epsilon subunit 2